MDEQGVLMPLYTFMNKDTDEVFTEMMSISQREEYLSQNPNITQQIVKVNMLKWHWTKE